MVRHFGAALVGGRKHRDYARSLGIPQAAIFTGYDAVDNEHFIRGSDQARARADEMRAAHRLPARYFLTSSRFIRIKNIDGLLRAYAQYVTRVTNPRDTVVCGDGECRESLHQLARELGLEQRVHWPGLPNAQLPILRPGPMPLSWPVPRSRGGWWSTRPWPAACPSSCPPVVGAHPISSRKVRMDSPLTRGIRSPWCKPCSSCPMIRPNATHWAPGPRHHRAFRNARLWRRLAGSRAYGPGAQGA